MDTASVIATTDTHRAETGARYECALLSGLGGLAALREDWSRLVRALPGARCYHTPEWCASYLAAHRDAAEVMHFVTLRRDTVLMGIVPLERVERRVAGLKLRALALPQNPHMLLADWLCARADAGAEMLGTLVRYLRQQPTVAWDALCLSGVPEDASLAQTLQAAPPALTIMARSTGCDYLPRTSFDELSATFSKNFRGNLRKARNKLARLAHVEYVTATRRPELEAALDEFLAVEASGWKGAAGTQSAIALDPATAAFYRALVAHFGPQGACEVNLLRAEGHCLAGQFCLAAGDTYMILKIGYDEAYAAVAPGNMLLEHTLQRLAARADIRRINLVTDAPWHTHWKPRTLGVFDTQVFNVTPAGLAAYVLRSGKRRARTLLQALRVRRGQARPDGTDRPQESEHDCE